MIEIRIYEKKLECEFKKYDSAIDVVDCNQQRSLFTVIWLMCFSVKYLPGLTFSGTDTVYLKAPEMFPNLANNCSASPNGKLITLSPSKKKKVQ